MDPVRPLSRREKMTLAALSAAFFTGVARRRRRGPPAGDGNEDGSSAKRALLKLVESASGLGTHRPAPLQKSWKRVFLDAYHKWSADNATRLAAALSYYTAFSIAPLVLITVALAALAFGQEAAQGMVTARFSEVLGPDKARALESMLAGARRPGSGGLASIVGFAIVLLGASGVVAELQASLNQIFGVSAIAGSFGVTLKRRLISFGFVLAVGFLMLVSLVLGAVVSAAGKYFGGLMGVREAMLQAANQLFSYAVITSLFTLMFRFLPEARLAWRDLWIGGAFTSALFTLGNFGLSVYLGKAGPASAYGAAGSIMAFLLWTYYCAQIFYFGAELTNAYAHGRGKGVQLKLTD